MDTCAALLQPQCSPVSGRHYDVLRRHLDLVGHYMTVARLTGTLEVDLDAHADSWTHEH